MGFEGDGICGFQQIISELGENIVNKTMTVMEWEVHRFGAMKMTNSMLTARWRKQEIYLHFYM